MWLNQPYANQRTMMVMWLTLTQINESSCGHDIGMMGMWVWVLTLTQINESSHQRIFMWLSVNSHANQRIFMWSWHWHDGNVGVGGF